MIKHIFCDLDGTLYHDGISDEDSNAIKEIEKKGVKFHIATGRIFKQAYNMTKDNIKLNGYYICENGSFIHDKDHQLIFKGTIDDNLIKKVINRFESDTAHLYFKYNGDVVLIGGEHIFKHYTSDFIVDPNFIKKDSFDNLVGNIGIVCDNLDELGRIELYFKSEFGELLDIYLSGPYTLNIVPKGVSKKASIEYVSEILGTKMDEIATIGDSPNDICMLEGFKYSFVMNDARDSVKKVANYKAKNVKEALDIINKINGVEN